MRQRNTEIKYSKTQNPKEAIKSIPHCKLRDTKFRKFETLSKYNDLLRDKCEKRNVNENIHTNYNNAVSEANLVMEHITKEINALRNELHWKLDHALNKKCRELKGTDRLRKHTTAHHLKKKSAIEVAANK